MKQKQTITKDEGGEKGEPKVTRVGHDFFVNGSKHKYQPYKMDRQELAVCKCGSKRFWVYQPLGAYETNIICTSCLESYCAHDG